LGAFGKAGLAAMKKLMALASPAASFLLRGRGSELRNFHSASLSKVLLEFWAAAPEVAGIFLCLRARFFLRSFFFDFNGAGETLGALVGALDCGVAD
jgi:hypothetical protein